MREIAVSNTYGNNRYCVYDMILICLHVFVCLKTVERSDKTS